MSLKIFGSSPGSLWNSAKKTVSKAVGGSSGSKPKKSGSKSTGSVKKTAKTSKSSTTQKYLTNAPALYSSSGKKVTTSSTSAYSTGRPAESYAPVSTSNTNKTKKATKKKSPRKPAHQSQLPPNHQLYIKRKKMPVRQVTPTTDHKLVIPIRSITHQPQAGEEKE